MLLGIIWDAICRDFLFLGLICGIALGYMSGLHRKEKITFKRGAIFFVLFIFFIFAPAIGSLCYHPSGLTDKTRDIVTLKNLKNLKIALEWYMNTYNAPLPTTQEAVISYLKARFGDYLPSAQLRSGAKGSLTSAYIKIADPINVALPGPKLIPPYGGWIYGIIQATRTVTLKDGSAKVETIKKGYFWVNSLDVDTKGVPYSSYSCE
jgi:hypothetical protein